MLFLDLVIDKILDGQASFLLDCPLMQLARIGDRPGYYPLVTISECIAKRPGLFSSPDVETQARPGSLWYNHNVIDTSRK